MFHNYNVEVKSQSDWFIFELNYIGCYVVKGDG